MLLDFEKLNGLGNDFIFIDDREEAIELSPEKVAALCDRHFGIGADGIILVRPSQQEDCAGYMHYINADGTLAQMCGNGVRCFAKYLVDHNIVESNSGELIADTLAGPRPIRFVTDNAGKMTQATVNMDAPILKPEAIPVSVPSNATTSEGQPCVIEAPLDSPWGAFTFTMVSMGNPHAVCFIDNWSQLPDELFDDPSNKSLDSFNIDMVGAFFESCSAFPEKANIEFAEIGENGIAMRVFERGCGETLACGTGACATAVAATLTKRADRSSRLFLRGGELDIEWTESGDVMMTGPATFAFEGKVEV